MNNEKKITVIGGLTMDLTYEIDKWPVQNQAVQAKHYFLNPGGKGLNQTLAASLLDIDVNLISTLGEDSFAKQIISLLKKCNIKVNNVICKKGVRTDLIGILLFESEPGFIGIKNSTILLNYEDLLEVKDSIADSSILLINSEVSDKLVLSALKLAKKLGLVTLYNPAPPSKDLDVEIYKNVDYFIPNEWEARYICRDGKNKSVSELCQYYQNLGAVNVIITRGKEGCVYSCKGQYREYSAFSVKEANEVGAGDAFCSTIAYGVMQGWDIDKTIRFASASGALTTMKKNTLDSFPVLSAVQHFLNKRKDIKL